MPDARPRGGEGHAGCLHPLVSTRVVRGDPQPPDSAALRWRFIALHPGLHLDRPPDSALGASPRPRWPLLYGGFRRMS